MPSEIAELEARALQLAPEQRARLADRLLCSLSADAQAPLDGLPQSGPARRAIGSVD